MQFVGLAENRSAAAAVRRAGRRLAGSPVPLFVHGPPGCGKTHLADLLHERAAPQGAVERWAARDDFDPAAAARAALVIVEDLQHLKAKAAARFGAMLDQRVARRAATLLTATAGPAGLEHLPRRLASRLAGGLVVGIAPLGTASRRLLLARFARDLKVKIPGDALDWLAGHLPGSGRQLQAAVRRLVGLPKIDVAIVRDVIAEDRGAPVTLERIVRQVARHFRVKEADLRGRGRQPAVVLPRQVAMHLGRELTGLSLARVGTFFGRDHTTIGHAVAKIAAMTKDDAGLAGRVAQLRAELAG